MEYDLSAEKSYLALFMQVGDIGPSFCLGIEGVRSALLDRAYKTTISSWRNMLSCYIDLALHQPNEEFKAASIVRKGKSREDPMANKRKAFTE